ncbi:uncharacterized protein LOC144434137 [Glandiceps talaboti]
MRALTLEQRAARWSANELKIGLPLVRATLKHLDFLALVKDHRYVHDDTIMTDAVKRYETLWLPLLASQGFIAEPMAAPIDIAWIWHVHMLAPQEYTKDCITVTSRILDNRIMSLKERAESLKKAQEYWEDMYVYDYFEIDLKERQSRGVDSPYQTPYITRIYYDLKSAARDQRIFNYQVSLSHYRSSKFLKSALARYKRYLYLQQCHPEDTLVPTYDISLMWHTHMLHPHKYRDDTTAIFGHPLPHDDQVILRNMTDRCHDAFDYTADLWATTFGEDYRRPGTAHRGDPPINLIPHNISSFKTDTYDFLIEKLVVSSPPKTDEFVMSMRIVGGEKVFRRKSTKCMWESKSRDGIVRFTFNESKKPCLLFKLKTIKLLGYNTVGTTTVPINAFMDKSAHGRRIEHSVVLTDSKGRHGGISMSITLRIIPDIGLDQLKVRTGSYSLSGDDSMYGLATIGGDVADRRTSLPSDFLHRVKLDTTTSPRPSTPVAMTSLLLEARQLSDGSKSAEHSLMNQNYQTVFTTRVTNNITRDYTKIEVLDHNGCLVALSETIDLRALPSRIQVPDLDPETCCTLQPEDNERAMIIKEPFSDWGICIGKWVREGVEPSHHGYNRPKLSFFGLSQRMEKKVTLIERNDFNFRLTSVLTLDLKKGCIRFKGSDASEVPQVVALAFAMALLLVITSPCKYPDKCQEKRSLVHKMMALPMVTATLY